MLAIDVIVPRSSPRQWHKVLIERLRGAGYDLAVVSAPEASRWPRSVAVVVGFERRLFRRPAPSLADTVPALVEDHRDRTAALRLDLSGQAPSSRTPTMRLAFDGSPSDVGVMAALAAGRLPQVEAIVDGRVVGRASPMVDKRESVVLGAEDVLARAITLAVSAIAAFAASPAGGAAPLTPAAAFPPMPGFVPAYLIGALPRLAREALRRTRFRSAHWRVGYRYIDGPGVAETGRLGSGWRVLADTGDHFYADPFAFSVAGSDFIFVEDYPHSTRKAVISVATLDADGIASRPVPVLEEPHHLSYPQVFARDGAIWMLPEASASRRLTLYRCQSFPDRWQPEAVLIAGREISDATLVEHGGLLYLLATDRDGHGSTSDTLVVYFAETLLGPWHAHPMNPIVIDRRASRPGGAVVMSGNGLLVPIQDGEDGYGGGLGLSEIRRLDPVRFALGAPKAISPEGDWPYPRIHTLNRHGRLEVIDGIAAVRKRQRANSKAS